MKRRTFLAAIATLSLAIGAAWHSRPVGAIPVFDSANYAQNILQAARSLEQINNQIQQLQNQATMLQNMAKNLRKLDYSSLGQLTGALQRIDGLMVQAQGLTYNVNTTSSLFQLHYPEQYAASVTSDQLVLDARANWRSSMDAYRHTMSVQSQVVENVANDSALLGELLAQSQGAEGALQAQQATNQLLALSTKQQLQIQTMMAAQFRAEAQEQARNAQSEERARVRSERFLGDRRAYTPR